MDVNVEDIGVCKKRLTIAIGRDEIDGKFDERYGELEEEAFVPGFRPGHAPRRLVEKRFARTVGEEVKVKLITEGFQEALKQEDLHIIGEPDLDPDDIELPEEGEMSFSVEVEVKPEFEVPDHEGIPVDVERKEVSDEDVDEALGRLRKAHAELRTLAKTAKAKDGDVVQGDLVIEADGEPVVEREDVSLPVDAIQVEGIPLETFKDIVEGTKVDEEATGTVGVPEDAQREDVQGKDVTVTVEVKEIRRPEEPDDEALVEKIGYESMDALRDSLRRQLAAEAEQAYSREQEQAIEDWLIEHTDFELPEELVERHTENVARRQMMNMMYQGVPADEIREHEDEIRSAAADRAQRDLKLSFILDEIAKAEDIEVSDAEVDARVRYMAMQQGRREGKLREEMAERGSLEQLSNQIRDDKVMRRLLDKAKVAGEEEEEAEQAGAEEEDAGEPGAGEEEPGEDTETT